MKFAVGEYPTAAKIPTALAFAKTAAKAFGVGENKEEVSFDTDTAKKDIKEGNKKKGTE